jgi:hypothetical protein
MVSDHVVLADDEQRLVTTLPELFPGRPAAADRDLQCGVVADVVRRRPNGTCHREIARIEIIAVMYAVTMSGKP